MGGREDTHSSLPCSPGGESGVWGSGEFRRRRGWGSLRPPGKEGEGSECWWKVSRFCRKEEAGGARLPAKGRFWSPASASLSEGHLYSLTAACAPARFPRRTLGPAQHFILSYFEGRRGGLKLAVEPNHSLLSGSHHPLPHPCFQVAKETA